MLPSSRRLIRHRARADLTYYRTMLRIPGDEYISSCLWPFRSRYSIAAKSFLLTLRFFRNSAL